MKARSQSNAGNPIRRPPTSGDSSGISMSSGYASSSGYSSGTSSVGRPDSMSMSMAISRGDDDYHDDDVIDVVIEANDSRVGSGSGGRSSTHSSTLSPYMSSTSTTPSEQMQLARFFFALACLWPLLFLLIPPGSSSHSHMALLTTGMDTMDSHTLSQHMAQIEARTHDKIDKLRSKVSGNMIAKKQYLQKEMKSLLKRTDVVGYGPSKPRIAVVVTVPHPPVSNKMNKKAGEDHSYEEQMLLNGALEAVESIFRTTDRNRVFIVTVVLDGVEASTKFEMRLDDIDSGRTAHRHGNEVHTHDHHQQHHGKDWKDKERKLVKNKGGGKGSAGEEEGEGKEAHSHSEKIHTIHNKESRGVSSTRKMGVDFINILAKKHEEAGLKSNEEDLILLFLRCDAILRENEDKDSRRTWLDDVTEALILTPPPEEYELPASLQDPLLTKSKTPKLAPPANAVSFVVDFSSTDTEGNINIHPSHTGDTLTFDQSMHPIISTATAQQMSLSNGESYPAPITQVATALRLATYNAFPSHDEQLSNHYSADLELSFNLWMCADGMDILGNSLARVVVDPQVLSPYEKAELTGPLAARLVSAWMAGHDDENIANGILQEVAGASATRYIDMKALAHGEKLMKDHSMAEHRELRDKMEELKHSLVRIASEAKQSSSFPLGLDKKCRPFAWYAEHVHPKMWFHESGFGAGDVDGDNSISDPHGEHGVVPGGQSSQKAQRKEKILPSQPLSEENMAIISKAAPVKLAYVDASGGHAAHPHKGATDENGVFGYVHDETALHKNPPPFEFKDDAEHALMCKKGDPNWKMLTEKVYVDLTQHEAAEKRAEHGLAKKKRAKIFCLVYTIEKFHDRIPAIRETWGQKCDGFMVASTKTDKKLGTVNIPHEGKEEYNNIWQKVRSMWSYIYDNYYEKYDYFHIGGDDLYLIVENLRLYLESEEIQLASNGGHYLPDGTEDTQTPLFMGRRFAEGGNRDRMFISGGAGYTMNKAALKTLVVDGFPQCFPHMHTFSEDVMVATCHRKMDILPYDTKDEARGERYMPFQPGHHLTYYPPKNPKDDWYANYSVDVKWGIDHCAAKSVAFHYIKEDLMKRMHSILYHHC